MLTGMAAERAAFTSCEIWKVPLNLERHPVLSKGTGLSSHPGIKRTCSEAIDVVGRQEKKVIVVCLLGAMAIYGV